MNGSTDQDLQHLIDYSTSIKNLLKTRQPLIGKEDIED